jgi:hypothetical protein
MRLLPFGLCEFHSGFVYTQTSVGRQQEAESWELRAAMSMARLWRDQGNRARPSASRSGPRLVHRRV